MPVVVSRRVLVLATALADAFAAMVEDERVVAERHVPGGRGLVERLPGLVEGLDLGNSELIACVIGPGSFTGIRAGLALAQGLAFGTNCPVVGVTVGEAVAHSLGRSGPVWVATDGQRGGVFLEGDGPPRAVAVADLRPVEGEMLIAGDSAKAVAAHLAALGGSVRIATRRLPGPLGIVRAARARLEGRLAPRACLPLYIDEPAVSREATDVRPPPA